MAATVAVMTGAFEPEAVIWKVWLNASFTDFSAGSESKSDVVTRLGRLQAVDLND